MYNNNRFYTRPRTGLPDPSSNGYENIGHNVGTEKKNHNRKQKEIYYTHQLNANQNKEINKKIIY